MTQVKEAFWGLHPRNENKRFGTGTDTSNAWLLWRKELREEERIEDRIDNRWKLTFGVAHNKGYQGLLDNKPRWNEPAIEGERIDELEFALNH
jgi:hypothetical protein